MKIVALLLIAASLCFADAQPTGKPLTPVQIAHRATYRIEQRTINTGGSCSATAIGPHALLTANHCEVASDTVQVSGTEVRGMATIDKRLRDGLDHTIYLLSGITFPHYLDVDQSNSMEPGQRVYLFGNPGEWRDIYREGYAAGIKPPAFLSLNPPMMMFDFPGFYGDSGSGIIDKDTNKIIAVLSEFAWQERDVQVAPLVFMASYPLHFKQAV